MAISLKGLSGPDEITRFEAGRAAPSGGGANFPQWGVGNPIMWEMSGLSKEAERYGAEHDNSVITKTQLDMREAYTTRYLDPENGEFKTRRGLDAKGMYDDGRTFFEDFMENNVRKNLSERQQRLFAPVAANEMRGYARQIASHEGQEILAHYKRENEVKISRAIDLAVADPLNPGALPEALGTLDGLYRERSGYEGWSKDYTALQLREAQGDVVTGMAAALAPDRPELAIGLLKDNKEFVSPVKYSKTLASLERHRRAEAARAEAEGLKQSVNEAISFNDMRAGADFIFAKYKDNPKKADEALGGYLAHYSRLERLENLQARIQLKPQIDALRDASEIEDETKRFDAVQQIMNELPLDQRKKLNGLADEAVGGNWKTSPEAKALAADLLADNMPVPDDIAARISKRDMEKLRNEDYRNNVRTIKQVFDTVADKWLADPANASLKKKYGYDRGTLWARFLSRTDADEKRDSRRLREEADDFFKQMILQDVGIWNTDKQVPAFAVPDLVTDGKNAYLPKRGSKDYEFLVKTLRENNIPVTEADMIKLYRDILRGKQ